MRRRTTLPLLCGKPVRGWSGWIWPVCFVLVGAIGLNYREA